MEYGRIEDKLYRYADISDAVLELESEIDLRMPSQTTSIVLFNTNNGMVANSKQEAFFTRPDILKLMGRVLLLQKEKKFMDCVLLRLQHKDYLFVKHTYLCREPSAGAWRGYSERGYYYKKEAVLVKIQNIIKKCSKLDIV